MATNFEFIEINDATGTPQKVGGDIETQGVDDLFHQTARNLNTRLEEATGVTIPSATDLDIALNGMESHVILDIGQTLTQLVRIQIQYTTGGKFYAAHYEPMNNPATRAGSLSVETTSPVAGYLLTPSDTGGATASGSQVFAIPTNGAVTIRLRANTSDLTGVSWARVVLAQAPWQNTITKNITVEETKTVTFSTANQPYASGDFLGDAVQFDTYNFPGNDYAHKPTLKDIYVPYDGLLPDFDLLIVSQFFNGGSPPGALDGVTWTGSDTTDTYGVLEFRATPTEHQYPIITMGTGGSAGIAKNIGFTPYAAGYSDGEFYMACLAKGAFTINGFFRAYCTWDRH